MREDRWNPVIFSKQNMDYVDTSTKVPDEAAHTDFEIDDCCGFDLDYWAEDICDDEMEDD